MKLRTLTDPKFLEALSKMISADVPMQVAFKLKKIISKIDDESKNYEELRKRLLSDYGHKDSNGELVVNEHGHVEFSEEFKEIFIKKHEELLDVEVSLPKISIKDLGDSIRLSTADLFLIEDILSE